MRIAFDATAILGPMSKNRGIGNYSLNQFKTMIHIDSNNQYFFFNLMEKDFTLNDLMEGDIVEEFALYSGPNYLLLKDVEYNTLVGEIIKKYIKEKKIDIFYITSPFESCNVHYKKEWFAGCKTVAIVYDIIPYVMRERYLTDLNTYNWYMECIDMLRWVDRIQVISQSVKDDLVSFLRFDENKIDVIWGGVDKSYKKIEISNEKRQDVFSKFNITGEYIMCTGGDDERKNISFLIKAYSHLSPFLIEKYQLVIVCKLSNDSLKKYKKIIRDCKVEGRVILTNCVSDEELLILYNLAELMAFPSTYEGFGLPVVEAWACGTPVLTSNNSSLVQIAGDAAVLVDPYNEKDITKGLAYALTECDLKLLLEKGKKRLEYFSWDNVASASIKSLESISLECNTWVKQKENRLAFFTPLPPIESGISDYSVDLIHELCHFYDIDIFIDDGYAPQIDFEQNVRIMCHSEFAANSQEYDKIIYQVGNSAYHLYMFQYIQNYKGIVVLHDYNMHGVMYYSAMQCEKNNYELYGKYLREDYPATDVEQYIHDLQKGICTHKIQEWELNGAITNYADKIIVHSFDAKEKLLQRDIKRDAKHVWSFVNLEDNLKLESKEVIKVRKGFEKTDILISAFGHIHGTKRIIPILNALKRLVKEYDNIKMVFAGKLADTIINEFNEIVKDSDLEHCVKVTGYIDLQEFTEYIRATDICLNLRYPYNGETSASLIRNLSMGNVVIVNDIGSFSEIPDDVCIKIPNVEFRTREEEIFDIYNAIKKCLDMPEKCVQLCKNAEKFAYRYLDVKEAAKKYSLIIDEETNDIIDESILSCVARQLKEYDAKEREVLSIAETFTWAKEA